ncbi:MAG TPA: hypothetical protein VMX35_03240 [Acidobacteriota bacterium]|nr:hypothetical protein [Acidobacteriota bacterium]
MNNQERNSLDYFDNLLSPDDIASKLDEPSARQFGERDAELRVAAGQEEQLMQLEVDRAILNELKKMNGLLHEILKKIKNR